jgi:hypothetical protein
MYMYVYLKSLPVKTTFLSMCIWVIAMQSKSRMSINSYVFACMYTYAHICIHTSIYIIYIYIYIYIRIQTYAYIYIYTHIHMHTCMYTTYTHTCIHTCMHTASLSTSKQSHLCIFRGCFVSENPSQSTCDAISLKNMIMPRVWEYAIHLRPWVVPKHSCLCLYRTYTFTMSLY